MSATRAFLRLELADSLRSRWVLFTSLTYVAVFGAFIWLGLRESSILGFTGVSRVILNLANAVVLVLPLVALASTSHAIVGGRTSGFFELFLSQPCKRSSWFLAAVGSRVAMIAGPLILLLATAGLYGHFRNEPALSGLLVRTGAVVLALTWAYVGLGLALSAVARTPERATVYVLEAGLISSALHDFALIGILLQIHLAPGAVFALAAANPVEAARLAILSSIDPELAVLGPVGFWLANTLGATKTLVIGLVWPVAFGTIAMLAAAWRLRRMDLVG